MPTPTYTLIEEQVLSSTAASVTFGTGGTLTQAYKDIDIEIIGGPATNADLVIQFNGDTGSHYSMTDMVGTGSAAASYRTSNSAYIFLDYTPGASGSVSQFYIVRLMSYSNGSVYKTVLTHSGSASTSTEAIVGNWRGSNGSSTEAITSVLIKANTGSLISGSTFRLWGIA